MWTDPRECPQTSADSIQQELRSHPGKWGTACTIHVCCLPHTAPSLHHLRGFERGQTPGHCEIKYFCLHSLADTVMSVHGCKVERNL